MPQPTDPPLSGEICRFLYLQPEKQFSEEFSRMVDQAPAPQPKPSDDPVE